MNSETKDKFDKFYFVFLSVASVIATVTLLLLYGFEVIQINNKKGAFAFVFINCGVLIQMISVYDNHLYLDNIKQRESRKELSNYLKTSFSTRRKIFRNLLVFLATYIIFDLTFLIANRTGFLDTFLNDPNNLSKIITYLGISISAGIIYPYFLIYYEASINLFQGSIQGATRLRIRYTWERMQKTLLRNEIKLFHTEFEKMSVELWMDQDGEFLKKKLRDKSFKKQVYKLLTRPSLISEKYYNLQVRVNLKEEDVENFVTHLQSGDKNQLTVLIRCANSLNIEELDKEIKNFYEKYKKEDFRKPPKESSSSLGRIGQRTNDKIGQRTNDKIDKWLEKMGKLRILFAIVYLILFAIVYLIFSLAVLLPTVIIQWAYDDLKYALRFDKNKYEKYVNEYIDLNEDKYHTFYMEFNNFMKSIRPDKQGASAFDSREWNTSLWSVFRKYTVKTILVSLTAVMGILLKPIINFILNQSPV